MPHTIVSKVSCLPTSICPFNWVPRILFLISNGNNFGVWESKPENPTRWSDCKKNPVNHRPLQRRLNPPVCKVFFCECDQGCENFIYIYIYTKKTYIYIYVKWPVASNISFLKQIVGGIWTFPLSFSSEYGFKIVYDHMSHMSFYRSQGVYPTNLLNSKH